MLWLVVPHLGGAGECKREECLSVTREMRLTRSTRPGDVQLMSRGDRWGDWRPSRPVEAPTCQEWDPHNPDGVSNQPAGRPLGHDLTVNVDPDPVEFDSTAPKAERPPSPPAASRTPARSSFRRPRAHPLRTTPAAGGWQAGRARTNAASECTGRPIDTVAEWLDLGGNTTRGVR